jgi:hypothetical protein
MLHNIFLFYLYQIQISYYLFGNDRKDLFLSENNMANILLTMSPIDDLSI